MMTKLHNTNLSGESYSVYLFQTNQKKDLRFSSPRDRFMTNLSRVLENERCFTPFSQVLDILYRSPRTLSSLE